MKDKQMKALLKKAYPITPTLREKQFLRTYEQRSLRLSDVLGLEMKYMGLPSAFAGVFLLLIFYFILKSQSELFMWYVSGALPVVALTLLSGLGRSERYGMQELEAASRFSLKFVKMVRMLILGAVSLVVLVLVSLCVQGRTAVSLPVVVGLIGTPYMFNAYGSLMITRRWREQDQLLGCLGTTAASCLMPQVLYRMVRLPAVEPLFMAVLLVLLTALTVREGLLYIKECEDLSWNFC